MANIRFLARAEVDLEDAVAWFEERSERAARRFEREVTVALDRIARLPELYSPVDDRHRICPVKKSQFLLVYRFESTTDTITVVAVPHAKQEPRDW